MSGIPIRSKAAIDVRMPSRIRRLPASAPIDVIRGAS